MRGSGATGRAVHGNAIWSFGEDFQRTWPPALIGLFFHIVAWRLAGPPFKCMPETARIGEPQSGSQRSDTIPFHFQTFECDRAK